MYIPLFISITILILLAAVFCMSCSKEKKLEGNLLLADSLNWNENTENVLGNIVTVKSYKENIYVLEPSRVSLYDFNSFKYIKSFGKQGSGPGEFKAAFDLCIANDTIYICDTANSRIQKFTLTGEYIDSFRYPLPFCLQTMEDTLFVMNYFKRPDLKISKIKNDIVIHELKIGKMVEDKGMSKYYKFFRVLDNKLILTMMSNSEFNMFEVSDSSLTTFNCISDPEISEISACTGHSGNFYVIAVHKDNNDVIKTESSAEHKKHLGMTEYLQIYDNELKLKKVFKIPDHILTGLSVLDVKDNYVLISDAFSNVLYKIRMEN